MRTVTLINYLTAPQLTKLTSSLTDFFGSRSSWQVLGVAPRGTARLADGPSCTRAGRDRCYHALVTR